MNGLRTGRRVKRNEYGDCSTLPDPGQRGPRPGQLRQATGRGTASNPLTIASWAAVFAAACTAGAARTTSDGVWLVVGVTAGSLAAVTALATLTALSRRALGHRALRLADAIAGLALLGFGGALGIATARDR